MEQAQPPTDDADPASAAVAHHLDALDAIWTDAHQEVSGSRAAQVRHGLVNRATAPAERRARDSSEHLAEALRALADRVERQASWQREDHGLVGDLRSALTRAEQRLDSIEPTVATLLQRLDALEARLAEQARRDAERNEDVSSDLSRLRRRIDQLSTPLVDAPTSNTPSQAQPVYADNGAEDLYRDLERRFRGTREDVRALLSVYLEDVAAVGGPVLDIGCGRGEWLELLRDADVPAYGVDTNAAFAEANAERGLDVRVGDAIDHLGSLEPATLGVITGFHLAEHLPLPVLLALADRSLRALRPGGLLILETPNPTNVRVGAAQFWLDPTHERPLHPELLQFLLAHRGFDPVEIRPLHPARHFDQAWDELLGIDAPPGSPAAEILADMRDALSGPQDYAVLATAPAAD